MKPLNIHIISILSGVLAVCVPLQADISLIDLTITSPVTEITSVADNQISIEFSQQDISQGFLENTSLNISIENALYLVTHSSQPDELLANHVSSGQDATFSFLFTAPSNAGIYYLYAYTDNQNIINESNEQNNFSGIITLEVIEPPVVTESQADLIVPDMHILGSTTVMSEERIFLSCTAENVGLRSTKTIENDDTSGLFDLAVYSYYLDPDIGQVQLQQRLDLWFCLNKDISDISSLAKELKTSDNPFSEYIKQRLSPNTINLLDSYDSTLTPSSELQSAIVAEFNIIIAGDNIYNEDVFSQVEIPLTIQDQIARNPQGEELMHLNRLLLETGFPSYLSTHLHGPLDSGSSIQFILNFPAPELPGTYFYAAVADKSNSVTELNEDNNWSSILKITVIEPLPDLVVSSSFINYQDEDMINVIVNLDNVGLADSSSINQLSFYLATSPDTRLITDDDLIARQNINMVLYPNLSELVNAAFILPDASQTYYLFPYIEMLDDGSGLQESNIDNNWGNPITIQSPDLVVSHIELLSDNDDSIMQVIVRIQNLNQSDINESFEVRLLGLSDENEEIIQAEILDTATVTAFAGDESKTLIMTYTNDSFGDIVYLKALVDPTDVIYEADETNNQSETLQIGDFGEGILIQKMVLKADRNRAFPRDSFTVSGYIDASIDAVSNSVTVSLLNRDGTVIFSEILEITKIEPGEDTPPDDSAAGNYSSWNLYSGLAGLGGSNNGIVFEKVKSNPPNVLYSSAYPENITSLKFHLRKNWEYKVGTFKISAQNVDLTELSAPVTLKISFDDFQGIDKANETIINDNAPIPLLFVSGVEDTLRLDKLVVNKWADSLVVKGGITAYNPDADLENKDLVITWGSQTYTVPRGSFIKNSGKNKYVCRRAIVIEDDMDPAEIDEDEAGRASITLDFDKAIFNISIKNTMNMILDTSPGKIFGLSYEGFNAETQVN
ncbi:MAG: hypothetical protein JW860_06345 [Sedimentisphaerales bacterium]|nr:hypothetical protein [Sedimentisphaerales bacterium]